MVSWVPLVQAGSPCEQKRTGMTTRFGDRSEDRPEAESSDSSIESEYCLRECDRQDEPEEDVPDDQVRREWMKIRTVEPLIHRLHDEPERREW